jgi:molybdenum cofactor guanylyltransferase
MVCLRLSPQSMTSPSSISAYILAGGRSSRMGRDKALVELAGKPLIAHAVTKLRRITPAVHILSNNPALAPHARLVPDLHPDTGPIGGIEAALAHSTSHWNLILPVDVPFLPTSFLEPWVRQTLEDEPRGARIALFTVDGIPQPALLMIHRDAALYISQAVARGDFKLFPVLEAAGRDLAARHGLTPQNVLCNAACEVQPLWFANLNTPEDFAEAEANIAALDT